MEPASSERAALPGIHRAGRRVSLVRLGAGPGARLALVATVSRTAGPDGAARDGGHTGVCVCVCCGQRLRAGAEPVQRCNLPTLTLRLVAALSVVASWMRTAFIPFSSSMKRYSLSSLGLFVISAILDCAPASCQSGGPPAAAVALPVLVDYGNNCRSRIILVIMLLKD